MKNKNILLIKRLFLWIIYLFSGYIVYSKQAYIYPLLINFVKVIYPLSIFWLQIRIKSKARLLPIDSSMSTSQLWFNILPVFACFVTTILTVFNAFLYIIDNLN